ncbi:predicted protein [Naegleria gruberi]|uniref:Predicted protein n=1 Tax=Naegleria gruberi TaxID=5762 RepID=D2V5Y2_NAEGR|nr:uncharacterized protein NAEGRDRAFT_64242 [Naegleria gruberi]EFC47878.1 predicted protein [Naegleria gruberi]|eukprot:XP_002680622.1 predicted protein [Naegleria gruberi strain NEG-M]
MSTTLSEELLDQLESRIQIAVKQALEEQSPNRYSDDTLVHLNVGGKKFTILKETIIYKIPNINKHQDDQEEYYPDNMFSIMLEGSIPFTTDEKGRIFLDRDPTYFPFILNYLRASGSRNQYVLPEDKLALKRLYLEANYYQLVGLCEHLEEIMPELESLVSIGRASSYRYAPNNECNYASGMKIFIRTKVLTIELCEVLNSFVGVEKDRKWKLLWQGSRDGFDSRSFHSKCDNKGPTVTIIRTSNNCIFGGYTEVSWNSFSGYSRDPNAFLFSLVNVNNIPSKHPIKHHASRYAIQNRLVNGPTFGSGHDIFICNNCDTRPDSMTFPCSYMEGTLTLTNDQQQSSQTVANNASSSTLVGQPLAPFDKNYFAGGKNFIVKEIEVFTLMY